MLLIPAPVLIALPGVTPGAVIPIVAMPALTVAVAVTVTLVITLIVALIVTLVIPLIMTLIVTLVVALLITVMTLLVDDHHTPVIAPLTVMLIVVLSPSPGITVAPMGHATGKA